MTERVKSLVKCRESAEVGVYILRLATELRTRTFFLLNWSATMMWLLSSFAGTFPRCRWWLTSLDVGHNYDQREQ